MRHTVHTRPTCVVIHLSDFVANLTTYCTSLVLYPFFDQLCYSFMLHLLPIMLKCTNYSPEV